MIQYSTEIEIGNIIIRDPVTALTNIGIFATGLVCYLRLRKREKEFPNRNWIYFFLLVGLSSLVGVIVHGFSAYTTPEIHFRIWWAMGVIQGAGMTLAQFAFASNALYRLRWTVISFVTLQFGAFTTLLYIYESFEVAKTHIALALMPILIYYLYKGSRGHKAERIVAIGIGVSCLTALVHSFKLSFSDWFTYNDIAHLLIIASLVVMYRGVKMGLADNSRDE